MSIVGYLEDTFVMFGVLQQLKVVIRAGKFTYCRFLQFTFKRNKQSFFVVTAWSNHTKANFRCAWLLTIPR